MADIVDKLIGGLKKAREVAQRIHDAELQNAIADLTIDTAQLKTEIADLREKNLELRARVDELLKQRDFRSKLEMREGLYYAREAIPGYSTGPFCPACLDSKGNLITLLPRKRSERGDVFRYDCTVCKMSQVL